MERKIQVMRPGFLAAVLLAISALCIASIRPEASYQGKPMSQWVRELDSADSGTCRAFSQAGSLAVPSLLAGLNKKDDPRFYAWLWPRMPAFLQRQVPRPAGYRCRRIMCAYTLGHIEPSTPNIVSELRRALTTGDRTLTEFAGLALRLIATRDPRMIPELERALPELREAIAAGKDSSPNRQLAETVFSIEAGRKRYDAER